MPRIINLNGPIVSDDDVWIYSLFGIPITCPSAISSAINDAAGDDLQVVVNSVGGDIFAATAIYDAISSYTGHISIKVIFAASAASFIACAAESEILPTGMLMLHNVSSYAEGNYRDMQHESEVLLNANRAIATAYRLKTGMTEAELLEIMDKETWLTADEAVAKGFINKISENKNLKHPQTVALAAALNGLLPESVIKAKKAERAQLNAELEILKLRSVTKHE